MSQELKIRKDLWGAIVSGDKQFEFRKLSKGLVTGWYKFVSIEYKCQCGTDKINTFGVGIDKTTGQKVCRWCGEPGFGPKEIYGGACLKPISINPYLSESRLGVPNMMELENSTPIIDPESYKFAKEKYIKQNIDFVAYEISNIVGNK